MVKKILHIHHAPLEDVRFAPLVPEGLALVETESTQNLARSWERPEEIVAGYDAVMIGGSSQFDIDGGRDEEDVARIGGRKVSARLAELVRYVVRHEMPFLGVCFGHQIVAVSHGGAVAHDAGQKKVGTYEVHLTEEGKRDPLLSNLPELFAAQYAHRDSVVSLPEGATLLASGDACRFSALRYGARAYMFQFHPELTAERLLIKARRGKYLPDGVSGESLVRATPEASRIIPLFIEKIVA